MWHTSAPGSSASAQVLTITPRVAAFAGGEIVAPDDRPDATPRALRAGSDAIGKVAGRFANLAVEVDPEGALQTIAGDAVARGARITRAFKMHSPAGDALESSRRVAANAAAGTRIFRGHGIAAPPRPQTGIRWDRGATAN